MKPIMVLMDSDFPEESLREESALDLRNIKDAAWGIILSTCRAADLHLYHIMVQSLDGIERLRNTSCLSMMWANKISNLAPVFQMVWLKKLSVSDFPRLRCIDGIEALQDLEELDLSGNLGSLQPPLRLTSVRPIEKLSNLEKLTLANIRLENDDITFLASLSKLRDLFLSNQFERKQFAYLAKRLNGQLDGPTQPSTKTNISCRRCPNPLYHFTGQRMPILCKVCDHDRFNKLTL